MRIIDFHTHLDTHWFNQPMPSEMDFLRGLDRFKIEAAASSRSKASTATAANTTTPCGPRTAASRSIDPFCHGRSQAR